MSSKKWFYVIVCMLMTAVMACTVLAEETLTLGKKQREQLEDAVEYLSDIDTDMEASVEFVLNVEEGTDMRLAVNAVTDALTQELKDELEDAAMEAADYPLIPDDVGFEAYMYWYQPKTNRCFVSVMSLSSGMMKIRLSVEPYEIVDVTWDDLPFGLQIGDGEQAVLKAIEDMVWHYTEFDMGRKLLDDGTYVIMLPGNETLEYIQLRVASMVTLQHFVEEKVPGIYDRLFWHITYHWKSHEIYQDRAAAMNLISETLYEKWNLAEFGNHNVYTMERKIEDVLGDDPVLESELWKVILEEIGVWCYDNLDIGMNTHDKHVTFRYQGRGKLFSDIVRDWLEAQ